MWPCLCFGDGVVSVSLVSCLWFFFFFFGFLYLFLGFIGFDLLEVYGFDFLDLLGGL